MELTESYKDVIPAAVVARYSWAETRKAAATFKATNPDQFDDFIKVLTDFKLTEAGDIIPAGGNESDTAKRLNKGFRDLGWREGAYKVTIKSKLTMKPWAGANEKIATTTEQEIDSSSYLIDNLKGTTALDVEWHAKDGNLDRDLAAYRSLHAETIIDVGILVTMHREPLREWVLKLDPDSKKYSTSTTTNLSKLEPRLRRGDAGGCPILVAAINAKTV